MFAKRAHLFIYSHYEYGVRLYSRNPIKGARAGGRGARGYPLRSPLGYVVTYTNVRLVRPRTDKLENMTENLAFVFLQQAGGNQI